VAEAPEEIAVLFFENPTSYPKTAPRPAVDMVNTPVAIRSFSIRGVTHAIDEWNNERRCLCLNAHSPRRMHNRLPINTAFAAVYLDRFFVVS
jgi:hypothetical protein